MWIVPSSEPHTIRLPSGVIATEITQEYTEIVFSIEGQHITGLAATRGMQGNFATNLLDIMDSVGAKGKADKYKCGVLCKIAGAKVRTKCRASLTASAMSAYSERSYATAAFINM